MRSKSARNLLRVVVALLACSSPSAGGDSYVPFVPWRILKAHEAPPKAPLILYWLPATRGEMRKSELLTARGLTLFATQCVAMEVVRPDDVKRVAKLADGDELPLALLIDDEGREVGRVEARHGVLSAAEVENMVGSELALRESAADELLDRARSMASDGARAEALVLYRRVSEQRCTCPRQARDALRALRKLGFSQ